MADKKLIEVEELSDFDYALIVKGNKVAKISAANLASVVGERIGIATASKNGLMSNTSFSKLMGIPYVASYNGMIDSEKYIAIPVNSDIIGAGFVRIGLCINESTYYGFKKASYDILVISGRQYGYNAQQGICNSVRPNGNSVYLKNIIYSFDENSILRIIYLQFNTKGYVSIYAENCTGNITIESSAKGTAKAVETGFNVVI